MKLRRILMGVVLALTPLVALGASLPSPFLTGPQDPSQIQAYVNSLANAVNQNVPGFSGQNFLDNGAFNITQRGTADTTGGTTSGCGITNYSADRWCVDTNVTSGQGHSQVITSSPSPPTGFTNAIKIWRQANALTQPIILEQEIKTVRTKQLQGRPVIASCFVQPLAGLTSASGAVNMYIMTGTGTDEGLGTLRGAVGMTASPALTPALAGVAITTLSAGAGSPSFSLGTTAAWSRIYSAPFAVPTTATEMVFAIGFTPVGSSSGTTDGIAIDGCQLEAADPNQTAPSGFQMIPYVSDLERALPYYWQFAETNGGYFCPGIASGTNAQTLICQAPLPFDAAPTMTFTAGGFSYRDNGNALAVSSPALSTASAATTAGSLTVTDTATQTVGHTAPLYGTATTGKVTFSADY